ncbi:MAG: hypothetical protein KU38_13250 [Sulfurovum sp. FS08-3]|nr:MAG: hypothetical protein KU38_13250 [Sulfurovum sp. FS08-3]
MKYCLEIIKDDDIQDDKFKSAFACLVTSIKSVFYDYEQIQIDANLPYIDIIQLANSDKILSLEECRKKIKGSITDVDGIIYPEFKKIVECLPSHKNKNN